tara:strand:+ start:116 stop:919 length:804 start_codon:yes stop_codon:yes gene_type:complete
VHELTADTKWQCPIPDPSALSAAITTLLQYETGLRVIGTGRTPFLPPALPSPAPPPSAPWTVNVNFYRTDLYPDNGNGHDDSGTYTNTPQCWSDSLWSTLSGYADWECGINAESDGRKIDGLYNTAKDNPHYTTILRSPLIASCASVTVISNRGGSSFKGQPSITTPYDADTNPIPKQTSTGGTSPHEYAFHGICLFDTSVDGGNGGYIECQTRPSGQQSNTYLQKTLTLTSFASGGPFYVDIIDARNGTWGWVAFTSVTGSGCTPP